MKVPAGDLPLFRIIVPAFPAANIYSRQAVRTTPLGPVMVATAANKLWGWRVEVYDENNFIGARDADGRPDHVALERERPASVVGFYCGLTSTMKRVYELATFYRAQGATCIAGSWHAHYMPREVLGHDIDIVIHGDGENTIRTVLQALAAGATLDHIPGISRMENGELRTTWGRPATHVELGGIASEVQHLGHLPYPDFGLLRHARRLKTYPISRIRGCGMVCEFCSVRGEPRWADARHLFNVVKWLVETRGATNFFIVDDRLEEDSEGTEEFFKLIAAKYGNSLRFAAQIRLGAATKPKLLEKMKAAGVGAVFIGYESPIDEDLKAMKKGLSAKKMIEWTHILRKYFWVHGMFIFGYPGTGSGLSVREMSKRYKRFIRKARITSIQVLHPVPIVGTRLRERLQEEGRLFPLSVVDWPYYDGNFAIFVPEGISQRELQEEPIRLMKWFYGRLGWRVAFRAIALPVDMAFRGWRRWLEGWRSLGVKYEANRIIREWDRHQDERAYVAQLEEYRQQHMDV